MNGTNTLAKFWINSVRIMRKNSITSSHLYIFCRKLVPRKHPIIPGRVDVFMLHIIYLLNVIITAGRLGIFWCFLFFVSWVWVNDKTWVSWVWINDKTGLAYFAKVAAWSYSFSWSCMNLQQLVHLIRIRGLIAFP